MRFKVLFFAAVMSVAVVSGICKGLSSPRGRSNGQEKEKAGDEKEVSAKKADL